MDRDETLMQQEKIFLIGKMVALLEEIAFNTSSKIVERSEYLARIYASSQSKSTAIHGDVRTQPTARKREMPEHDPATVSRLRSNAKFGPSETRPKA